ncbi:FIST N-terminal domain-containing protein [Elusimicrobiota bacterium]
MTNLIGVGISSNPDPLQRGREASDIAMGDARAVRADTVIVFAQADGAREYSQILKGVREVTGAANIVGSSASGVLTMEEEHEEGPACAVMVFGIQKDTISKWPSFLWKSNGDNARLVDEFKRRQLGSIAVLGDPGCFEPDNWEELCKHFKLPLVGGGASAFLQQLPGAPIFFGDESLREACCLLGFPNDLEAHTVIAQSCRAITTPYKITKMQNNMILELEGNPAAVVLEKNLKKMLSENKSNRSWEKPLPLLAGILAAPPRETKIQPPSEFYVRPILAVDTHLGGILLGDNLKEGSYIAFVLREKEWASQKMGESLASLKKNLDGRKPKFGLYFNCTGRGADLYAVKNHDVDMIKTYLGQFPLIGMFSSFEVLGRETSFAMHGFTGLLVVFTEAKQASQVKN